MVDQFERLQEEVSAEAHGKKYKIRGRFFTFLLASIVVSLFLIWQGVQVLSRAPVINIGDEAKVDVFVYSIQKIETILVIEEGILSRRAKGVYKLVTMTVRNDTDEKQRVNEAIFSVVDSEGVEYYPICRSDLGSCVEALPQTFTENIIDPDEEVFAVFIFDVEKEATGFKMKIVDDKFTGTHSLFDLD